jgi:peptide/nickel transport system substrate-binding protein
MRINILKWLFLIFAIAIMIFAIQKINESESSNEESTSTSNIQEEEQTQELKLGIAEFDTINPILSTNKYVQDISKIIYEPLFNVTEDYNIEPGLATECAKNGDNSYIIKLREDAIWSDGTSITSADVLYTVEKLKSISSIYENNVKKITKIESLNNYMVKISTDSEIPHIGYFLNFPIMSSSYYGEEDFQTTSKNDMPVASGMYKIASTSSNCIVLEKNENWYGISEKDAILEKITINLYSSVGELYNAFKLGQVDILSTNNINIENYIGTIGYQKKEFAGREYDFITVNTQNELLQDSVVRQAINYAINKTQIVNDIYGGKYYVSNFPLDFGSWIYKDDNAIGYDVEKAKQLLEEAGWKYQYGYWQKYENYRTKRLSFRILVDGNNTKRVEVANLIKSQLAEAGIVATVVTLTDEAYTTAAYQNKDYDLFLMGINVSTNIDLSTYFGSDNLANYSNEEAVSIINEIKNTTDEEILKEKYKRLIEIYDTEVPYISLYNNYTIIAYSSELSADVASSWYSMFYNIEQWHK